MKSLMDHLFTHTPVKANKADTGNRKRPRPALRRTKSYNPLALEPEEKMEAEAGNSNSAAAAAANDNKECRVCNKSFKHFGHLFNHMRKFHGDDGEEEQTETGRDIETPAWRATDAADNEVSLPLSNCDRI